ncbi:MAG: FMN-binding protein MioC [Pseudomonadota bacterium]|uniref:FMN-binding protein MioC n=1 Tax=Gallaecimonas pentaromativorans TaxID=584787 RepID=UPI00067F69C5|nr:FMN-binding protein MioC [Gallaecimonas pentaromativorans]MED5526779.1 FMN-binding protein MioC [Pseudomonadota bacterium]
MSDIHILVGSTLGGSEYVADALCETLQQHQHQVQIHLSPDLGSLPTNGIWLLCSSTHGAGDLPDNIQPFAEQLAGKPDLSQIRFAVFAIGDSSYDTFCEGGKQLEKAMIACQATEIWPRIDIDVLAEQLPEDLANAYLEAQISKI